MYTAVTIGGQRISLTPAMAIGKGGEADIYDIGGGKALKVFKSPDHPDYQGDPHEQEGARERLATHQRKLPAFPTNLPPHVIAPLELAYAGARGNNIVGYDMRFIQGAEVLLRYAERNFRQAGVPNNTLLAIFRDLHATVAGIHRAGAVIGDFNNLNVLVLGEEAYIVDADSFQFGPFPCRVFTARFVDPLLCDPNLSSPMLVKPHNQFSDWYAYTVMLMECLLYVDPYGGVYVPKNPANRIAHPTRPLRRITVFHPEVRYPKPAVPYAVLPDDLLEYLHRIFEKDERGEFPLKLLDMRWTTCSNCKAEHARNICPFCSTRVPGAVKEATRVKGQVMATEVFRTPGLIVFAAVQGRKLLYLYHENGQYKREDGSVVVSGPLDPLMRFRIQEDTTLLGQNGQVVALSPGKAPERISVDSFGTLPIFDANDASWYWLEQGRLLRNGQWAPEYIGDVLAGQTLFWVGSAFGFGFYRAGGLNVAFVFDAKRRGVNDNVQIGPIRGQLIDSTCVFTSDRCWFFVATQQGGKTIHHVWVVRSDGTVEATAQAEKGDGSWLGGTIRGKCAAGTFLLAATDEGIVRIDVDNGQLVLTREFPDTEPFVDSASHLFPGEGGIYVVSSHAISLLKIS